MKPKVNGYYGELSAPHSMVYEQEGVEVLHVTISEQFNDKIMEEMLGKIDEIVRQYLEVT